MNKVMLIGNVGKDPEVHYFEADQAIAKVSLATTERGYTLPNGTQVPDRTDWHYLMFSRRLAKIVEQYVHKVTRYMWKVGCATVPMTTNVVSDINIPK